MTRTHGLTRILAAVLAIGAVAAPAAVARPAETWAHLYAVGPINAPGTDVSARDQQAPAATAGQDLRSPDAADPSRPPSPQPVTFSPTQTVDKDGTSWSTIGLLLGGACFALAGAAVAAGRIRRRTGRAGAAA
jgi:hypothetical protein